VQAFKKNYFLPEQLKGKDMNSPHQDGINNPL
jgi:hypothetical protein